MTCLPGRRWTKSALRAESQNPSAAVDKRPRFRFIARQQSAPASGMLSFNPGCHPAAFRLGYGNNHRVTMDGFRPHYRGASSTHSPMIPSCPSVRLQSDSAGPSRDLHGTLRNSSRYSSILLDNIRVANIIVLDHERWHRNIQIFIAEKHPCPSL